MKKKHLSLGMALCLLFIFIFSAGTLAETVSHSKLDINTARTILQHVVGKAELIAEDQYWLDQNWDGKLDIADARIVLQKLVGKWVPERLTVEPKDTAEGDDIDFYVMSYTPYNCRSYGYFIARSLTELKIINGPGFWDVIFDSDGNFVDVCFDMPEYYDDAFFDKYIVMMIYSSQVGSVDQIVESLNTRDDFLTITFARADTSSPEIAGAPAGKALNMLSIKDLNIPSLKGYSPATYYYRIILITTSKNHKLKNRLYQGFSVYFLL